ncbi:MAG: hypothetical protein E7256_04890 [Lachnospiraceae bacterium]|nr:hypothetical protein [Lachnospiraceae bacterium]
MFDRKLVKKLVNAVGIKKDDLVLLQFWGNDDQLETVHNFSYEVAALGATPVELHQSLEKNRNILSAMKEGCYNDKFFSMFDKVDVVLDIMMTRPGFPGKGLEEEQIALANQYIGRYFGMLVSKPKMVQIRIPSKDNAADAGMEEKEFEERLIKACDIDYEAVKKACEDKLKEIGTKTQVSIHTGADCILTLDLTGREWEKDAGDGDLPCGEICIAPLENKTNGTVYFEQLFADGEDMGAVTITVENGIAITSDSEAFNGFLAELPPNGNVVCELGIGMNPGVTDLCGCEVLDEKMIGTFHIALGKNDMFGGTNDSLVHLDFVGHGEVIFS